MTNIKEAGRTARRNGQEEEQVEVIDFKMVTFSLGGKDYGLDIMKVKEIAKANRFTYVPNSAPYVRGVFNLRGEIISVLDLRKLFHLPYEEAAENEMENMIILRLEENIIGVIVDSIDRVIGISSERIQPPHPIFGDVNIKYISGVVEYEETLYIILDAERIFAEDQAASAEREMYVAPSSPDEQTEKEQPQRPGESEEELDASFVYESLKTFRNFYVTNLNKDWVSTRFTQWKDVRTQAGLQVQLQQEEEADEFLAVFFSPYTGKFWDTDYAEHVRSVLPQPPGNTVTVWNPGCGSGYESYSLACLLKTMYPEKLIKIYANDNDLLKISTAPNLIAGNDFVTDLVQPFMNETKNGMAFGQEIQDSIFFEYHDILHSNQVPESDIIIARDLLSFLEESAQNNLLNDCKAKLKPHGVLIIGQNESLREYEDWNLVGNGNISVYTK